jgi:3-deoxy-D-manno-octulosonic-acid transferase
MNWRRGLYSLLWWAATPLIRRYLKKRARKAPAYLQHWDERFGQARLPGDRGDLDSCGIGGRNPCRLPLIQAIRQRWPDAPLLLTQMTPTGRDTACQLYPDAEVRYLPYDYPGAVRDFLAVWQPRFGVLMETELWPNLLHAARQQGVPVFLANARLSEKSLRGYRRIQGLIGPALRDLTAIAVQSQQDAERLQQLGAVSPQVCGNTKYDFTPPAAMAELAAQFRQRIGSRPVFICASTRDGEEQLILQAWQQPRWAIPCCCWCRVTRNASTAWRGCTGQGLPCNAAATTAILLPTPACGWATAWASCLPTMAVPMWLLSAAACCRWVGRT